MFRVEWLQRALDDLTTGWLQASAQERLAITSASHALEEGLRTDPQHEGESREGDVRIAFEAPLAVSFHVDPYRRLVTVLHVRLFRRRQ